jgi:phage shock protein A
MLEKYQSLHSKYKDLKQVEVVASETRSELEKDISSLNGKVFSLESNNSALKRNFSKLEEEIISEASGTDCVIRYDRAFQ